MKALVLASGGVDSTTCLGLAVDQYGSENVIALAITYGQRHTKENRSRKSGGGSLSCGDAAPGSDTDFPVQRLFTSQSF